MFPSENGSSGIISWPSHVRNSAKVHCIVCETTVPASEVTAGSCYADGQQAFACREHTWNKSTWLRAWAQFSYSQTSGENDETELLYRKMA